MQSNLSCSCLWVTPVTEPAHRFLWIDYKKRGMRASLHIITYEKQNKKRRPSAFAENRYLEKRRHLAPHPQTLTWRAVSNDSIKCGSFRVPILACVCINFVSVLSRGFHQHCVGLAYLFFFFFFVSCTQQRRVGGAKHDRVMQGTQLVSRT